MPTAGTFHARANFVHRNKNFVILNYPLNGFLHTKEAGKITKSKVRNQPQVSNLHNAMCLRQCVGFSPRLCQIGYYLLKNLGKTAAFQGLAKVTTHTDTQIERQSS